jgi:predicted nucleic-acid-binding protein
MGKGPYGQRRLTSARTGARYNLTLSRRTYTAFGTPGRHHQTTTDRSLSCDISAVLIKLNQNDLHSSNDDFKAAAASMVKNGLLPIKQLTRHVAVTLPCLCESVWVLRRLYEFGREDIAAAIRALTDTAYVALNRPPVEAGLAILNAGEAFAYGLIAYEGSWLGAETFVSFDKKAIALLAKHKYETRLLR